MSARSPAPSASRVAAEMPALLFEGKRYEQVFNAEREGLAQRSGWMRVIDLASGVSTFVQIYQTARESGLESDAGDVFFRSFERDQRLRALRILSERGQGYVYDIDSGTVSTAG